MRYLMALLIFACLTLASVTTSESKSSKPVDDLSQATLVKKWQADQDSAEKNTIHTEIHEEKVFDYKTGKLKKEEITKWEYMFNGRNGRREIPNGQQTGLGGFEPVKSGFNFEQLSVLDRLTFVQSDPEEEQGRRFYILTLRTLAGNSKTKVEIKGFDVSDVVDKLVIEAEVWADGTLKGFRVSLSEEVKIKIIGPLAGGKIEIFKGEVTTQLVDGRVVPLRVHVVYKFTSIGILGNFARVFTHSIKQNGELTITYSGYKHMTLMEKLDYLTKTKGFGKVIKRKK